MDQKTIPNYVFYKNSMLYKGTYILKVKEWKKIYDNNTNQKKAVVLTLISDRADFKGREIRRDEEGHYTMIKDQFSRRHNNP